jgi:hypothetical protein
MIAISSGPALQHVECSRLPHAATGELVPASLSDTAPWLYSALSQLHELENSGQKIAGAGDTRVSNIASGRMRTILSVIDVGTLPAPVLYAVTGGGLGMRWDVGRREVEFTIFDNGNAVMAKLENSELVDDTDLADDIYPEVREYLEWLGGAR